LCRQRLYDLCGGSSYGRLIIGLDIDSVGLGFLTGWALCCRLVVHGALVLGRLRSTRIRRAGLLLPAGGRAHIVLGLGGLNAATHLVQHVGETWTLRVSGSIEARKSGATSLTRALQSKLVNG
jgi:hypothetical protein